MADWLSTILGLDKAGGRKTEYEIREVKISDIVESPNQPREHFEENKIKELSASITEFGVIQPIVVRKKGSYYELVAGERRLRASRMADMETIPAVVRKLSDEESLAFSLVENLQREDLNPIEEAKVYLKLVRDLKLTQKEVAEKLGKSPLFITDMVKLLRLPGEVKEKLAEGKITKGHGLSLLRLKDKKQQVDVLHEVIRHELSVRQTEQLVTAALKSEGKKKVKVKAAPGKERINIEHYVTHFQRIVEELKGDGGNVKFKKVVSKDYLELRVLIPLYQKKGKIQAEGMGAQTQETKKAERTPTAEEVLKPFKEADKLESVNGGEAAATGNGAGDGQNVALADAKPEN